MYGDCLFLTSQGKIVTIKESAAWGKSAQETLLQREEAAGKWKDMKIRGADDIVVAARQE